MFDYDYTYEYVTEHGDVRQLVLEYPFGEQPNSIKVSEGDAIYQAQLILAGGIPVYSVSHAWREQGV